MMFLRSKSLKTMLRKYLAILLLTGLAITMLPISQASAATPAITLKWSASVAGGGEAILTYDVRSDYAGEEVFHAGGPAQPNSTAGKVTCVSGVTGQQIWQRSIPGIGSTATMQMADVDRDGKLEIIVALQAPAGLYVLNAEDGSTLWRAPGTYNGNLGYFTPIGGRIDGSGVVGDTDSDSNLDIFIGVMAYEKQPTTGKLIHLEWDSTQKTIVERGRVQVWHPCAGGLSLGDTDNDGVYELYMNERDAYFGDGSAGRGITSFWANNLTKRWSIYDWGASSNIPMLADVNKDGILDVVSTNLGGGICVLNSTDGRPLKGRNGVVLFNQDLGLGCHYQSTVYDFDGDGNLELICADGSHSYSPSGTYVWDLYNWQLDKTLNPGLAFRGPDIGEVTGDGQMDMVVVTFDSTKTNGDGFKIYDHNYNLEFQYTGLQFRAIGSVVQDIDRDGKNELLILTQGQRIYCFDTPGIPSNPRARSEVHFYSESRLGVSQYVAYDRPWPDVVSPSPSLAVNVPTSLTRLSFTLKHPLGQTMTYTVTTAPNIGSGSGSGSGLKTVSISGLKASTAYSWHVAVTDQSGHTTSKTYWFTTAPTNLNVAPTQGTPVLSSSSGNTVNGDLTCKNQSTTDANKNKVVNIYNWFKNGASIDNLNLAFDSKPDSNAVYSGTATTRDYSGLGNTGTVFGATWSSSGVVGGAFYFGGNDFIRVEEQSNSLGGSGTWTQMSLEFWIKVPTTAPSGTKTVISKPDRYSESASGSYEVDVTYSSTQLKFTWYITTTTGKVYSVSSTISSGVNSWHHVVCTYLSGTGLKIYLDGSQKATASGSGNVNGTKGPLEIAFNNGNDFVGYLDEVRLYPSAVSASFVNQRYVETKSGSSSSEIIPRSSLKVGDQWICKATPNDGLADGTTKSSNTIKIV